MLFQNVIAFVPLLASAALASPTTHAHKTRDDAWPKLAPVNSTNLNTVCDGFTKITYHDLQLPSEINKCYHKTGNTQNYFSISVFYITGTGDQSATVKLDMDTCEKKMAEAEADIATVPDENKHLNGYAEDGDWSYVIGKMKPSQVKTNECIELE
ncbi:hypothetical protein EJ04DRAFT_569578 [Polyplosphaeria fusca]|uniref:Uncharacterized protein n=1 Tax=Polyplosphaeria fusca TaxID=682080 RepID=A0A9P4QP19_9PLEO|nr:hypothetical protein EJ04DRAFT_569578 [Polyplosphaeria fusca]